MIDTMFYKDKENSYPRPPKLHLTCGGGWTAHEDTKFWWKKPKKPVVANLDHFPRETAGAHLSFSAIARRASGVKPELQLPHDISAGCLEHTRCWENSFLNWESCREALLPFYALANFKIRSLLWNTVPKLSVMETEKLKNLKKKKKFKTIPGVTSQFLGAVQYLSRTE